MRRALSSHGVVSRCTAIGALSRTLDEALLPPRRNATKRPQVATSAALICGSSVSPRAGEEDAAEAVLSQLPGLVAQQLERAVRAVVDVRQQLIAPLGAAVRAGQAGGPAATNPARPHSRRKGRRGQAQMRRQGVSTSPVHEILDPVRDELPAIAQAAGIDGIVCRWDPVSHDP